MKISRDIMKDQDISQWLMLEKTLMVPNSSQLSLRLIGLMIIMWSLEKLNKASNYQKTQKNVEARLAKHQKQSKLLILELCDFFFFFFLMIRRPPRSTHCISSAASDVYKRQVSTQSTWGIYFYIKKYIYLKNKCQKNKIAFLISQLVVEKLKELYLRCSGMMFLQPVKTLNAYALVKREQENLENHFTIKDHSSTELFHNSWLREVTSLLVMELEVNQFMD
eukprot:TRINITY_DN12_c0_g1_i6.p1 TRINITY_DN12_c0_g1~~TRINITY_DN12_c0_g1_i6.p1  ORF type:complete len:222 (-),score=44.34 TRINITY_DN12_c0_g1_i6:252-917(-)